VRGAAIELGWILAPLISCGGRTGLESDPPVVRQPLDAGVDAAPTPDDCIEVPPAPEIRDIEVSFVARTERADVFFLVDCTTSMADEIEEIRRRLLTQIVPSAADAFADVAFGVGAFADFDDGSDRYGWAADRPFSLVSPISPDVGRAEDGLYRLPLWHGGDTPESQTEALFQSVTGEGIGEFVPPAGACDPSGAGYPCFRPGSQPVVLLLSDAPFHEGPDGAEPYEGISPAPHTWADTVAALQLMGVRFIGLDSGDDFASGLDDLERTAAATDSVTADGTPLAFSIAPDGTGLGDTVVDAVRSLVDDVLLDVEAVALDASGDGIDARDLILELRGVRAVPADAVYRMEYARMYGVRPGALLVFALRLQDPGLLGPGDVALLRVRLETLNGAVLDERLLAVMAPGASCS